MASEGASNYSQAAQFFLATVERVRPDQWDSPGLGEWSVRDLVGHTGRSFVTVETYLAQPAERVERADAVEYYVTALSTFGNPAEVAQRGRDAGAALGPDPLGVLREQARRALELVGASDGERLLTTLVGGMRLRDYLQTRVFELVVHTLDLAAAIGAAVEPPAEPLALCVELAARLPVRRG